MQRDFPPIIDGHNDTLTRVFGPDGGGASELVGGSDAGHLDVPRAVRGGLAAGFFAIFIRARPLADAAPPPDAPERDEQGNWTFTPPPIEHGWAVEETQRLLDEFDAMRLSSSQSVQLIRSTTDLVESLHDDRLGIILHIEGCEMLSPDLRELGPLYERGLRSLGPVWSRPNCFGSGIRFGWRSTNDLGPGLSEAGRKLIGACNEMGIMIDLSHLNYRGFMDVASLSDRPLVATHCGCHALAESARNLTDDQLRAIADSGGLVGCNFFTGDLRGDGEFGSDMPLSRLAEHIEHMVSVMGDAHVALGSDFDGADMCDEMRDVTCLPNLIGLLRDRGWEAGPLRRLCCDNWIRVLRETWQD